MHTHPHTHTHQVATIIPDLDVELKHFVEDEEEIAEKDTVTLQVTLTRLNLADGQRSSPVHAPFFPKKKDEAWWVVLTEVEHKHLITVEKITDLRLVVGEHTARLPSASCCS